MRILSQFSKVGIDDVPTRAGNYDILHAHYARELYSWIVVSVRSLPADHSAVQIIELKRSERHAIRVWLMER